MSALTAEELGLLRIQLSSLPGFDPVGLRVWTRLGAGLCTLGPDDQRNGYLVEGAGDGWTGGVHLDLADASTADRLARHLAARVGLEVGCTAPGWKCHDAGWVLTVFGKGRFFCHLSSNSRPDGHPSIVPALADLDPYDDRRLPDGALYRDRLALALSAVHVGGGG